MQKKLSEEIEFIRKQMIKLGKTYHLSSEITVEKSRQLDDLLNALSKYNSTHF